MTSKWGQGGSCDPKVGIYGDRGAAVTPKWGQGAAVTPKWGQGGSCDPKVGIYGDRGQL